MIAGALIGALAGGISNGLITNYQTKKLANAYKEAAQDIRVAGQKYRGQAANAAMTQEGARQAQQMQKLAQSQGVAGTTGLSTADATNMTQNQPGLSAYIQGQSLGRGNKATELNSKYNAATTKAQNMLSKANTDFKAGQAATQLGMNALSGVANAGNNIGGSAGMNALTQSAGNMFSDENCKESITNSSGDKIPTADVEDALRQIESIEYQYKPETGLDQDKHVGISAQSIEGTPLDNGVVHNDGPYKTLDKQKLLESVMAGIAAMQKEIDEINSKRMVSDTECKQVAKVVENEIESSPNPVETAEAIAPGAENIKEEAEQIIDGNPHNVEVNNEKVEEDIDKIIDNDDTVVDENVPEVNENDFVKSDILPSADNVIELKQEESLPIDSDIPEQPVDDQSIIDGQSVIDNGLEDQNQYTESIDDRAVVDTIELEPEEKETVAEAIEEVVPEEDKETYFGMLGIPHRGLSSSSSASPVKDDTYKIDKLNKAGSVILGNLNNALPTSSGSVSASSVGNVDKAANPMTPETAKAAGGKVDLDSPSAAANAELGSRSGNSNNGFTTSNGGSISSGPVNKGSSLKTSSVSLPSKTEHTAEANNIDLSAASIDALKEAIIKLDDNIAAANEIDKKALTYKGISIEKLPPEMINELWRIING